MAEHEKLDKDYLFKTAIRMIGDAEGFNSIQMNRSLNILTTVFEGVDFVSSKNMLSVERCKDSIIIKNFEGCKRMSADTFYIMRNLYARLLLTIAEETLMYFSSLWRMRSILKRTL